MRLLRVCVYACVLPGKKVKKRRRLWCRGYGVRVRGEEDEEEGALGKY